VFLWTPDARERSSRDQFKAARAVRNCPGFTLSLCNNITCDNVIIGRWLASPDRKSRRPAPHGGGQPRSGAPQCAIEVARMPNLGHITGSRSPIQQVYDQYDRMDEMREAQDRFEAHLRKIIDAP